MKCPLCGQEKRRVPAMGEHLWLVHENEVEARRVNPSDPVIGALPPEVFQAYKEVRNSYYHLLGS